MTFGQLNGIQQIVPKPSFDLQLVEVITTLPCSFKKFPKIKSQSFYCISFSNHLPKKLIGGMSGVSKVVNSQSTD